MRFAPCPLVLGYVLCDMNSCWEKLGIWVKPRLGWFLLVGMDIWKQRECAVTNAMDCGRGEDTEPLQLICDVIL